MSIKQREGEDKGQDKEKGEVEIGDGMYKEEGQKEGKT